MAENTPRDLDWEMLALKLAIIDPDLYAKFAKFARFNADRYGPYPDWILPYANTQKTMGIYPLTGMEGERMREAIWKLMGK